MFEQQQLSDENQAIMSAISGLGARTPTSTLSPQTDNPSGSAGGLPNMAGGPTATPVYGQTQQMFQPQQFNPVAPSPYQPMLNHGIGKDQWGSRMGLDQQAIMNSLGLGGQ